MEGFKVGDVVRLKSGSPAMTISFIRENDKVAICKWFANNGVHVERIEQELLMPGTADPF